ncbi:MAG TPA: hypothetical protein VFX89_06810 [Gammaproteobacteria bacterium]|nr:hypothetical protein [Gammaproteobacteria bacterium]
MNASVEHPKPRSSAAKAARDAFLRGTPEPAPAAAGDDAATHLLELGKLVAAKNLRAFPALAAALDRARPLLDEAGEHARLHASAAAAWLAHRPLLAGHLYSIASAKDPHDLLALRLAQSTWFFLARRPKVHAVAARAARAWSPADESHDVALALHAFGCAEVGDADCAEALALRALEIEPRNPYAIHALAHALGERRDYDAVVRLLRTHAPQWRVGGRLQSHTAWHLAVAELDTGDAARAAHALHTELVPLAAEGPSAAGDATDLAWRLDLAGVDVGAAWQQIADGWQSHHTFGFWAPDDVLAGIAYVRAERFGRARALERALAAGPHLRRCAEGAARVLTLPSVAAIQDFARGDFASSAARLGATIGVMGGSMLQRELFELTIRAAERRRAPARLRISA